MDRLLVSFNFSLMAKDSKEKQQKKPNPPPKEFQNLFSSLALSPKKITQTTTGAP